MRRAEDAGLQGIIHGECGDTMEVYLQLRDGLIGEATFMTDGGDSIVACGVALVEMVRGKTPGAAGLITPEELLEAVGGLPPAKVHCAKLAVRALRAAVGAGGPV
ncbi:MAG TPA: iron-sulfur cluster assembly scaffold protein [Acidimicrobiia bacterium]|nr:iron-sulfur cluster assembly scaffold protein [Acidimicrobiia bacterium]